MRNRRPREDSADEPAERSNREAELLGLVEREHDPELLNIEPTEPDYRGTPTASPPEPTALPFRNLRDR